MLELKEQLSYIADPDMPATSVRPFRQHSCCIRLIQSQPSQRFLKKLQNTHELYKRVSDMLDNYARGIDASNGSIS